jgi:hypothetical protein
MARIVDWCGVVSGRDVDKFAETGLTPGPALAVQSPIVQECPLNIECRVTRTLPLGSHTLFLAEVVAVQATRPSWMKRDASTWRRAAFCLRPRPLLRLGRHLGHLVFVRKRKPKRKVLKRSGRALLTAPHRSRKISGQSLPHPGRGLLGLLDDSSESSATVGSSWINPGPGRRAAHPCPCPRLPWRP